MTGLRQPALCAGAAPTAERRDRRRFRAGCPLQSARPLSDVADPATADLSTARGDVGIRNGERLSLPTEIKVLMQNTGTSHLMAISGLHIALAASLIMLLLRGVQYILPGRWIGWRLPLLAGLAGAVGYAADRYAAAGPAHLLRACGLLCFTFVGSTLDGVAGVALLSGSDTGCRPAGGPVAKPVAICLRRGGADLLVPVAPCCLPAAGAGRGSP